MSVTATGTSPYNYHWSNNFSTASVGNLAAGSYTVTVNDASGCSSTSTIQITEPTAIGITLTPASATCGSANGSVTSQVTGGTMGYTYHWAGGQSTPSLSNATSGSYALTVTDANSCTVISTATVGSIGSLTLATSSVDVTCNAAGNGSATVTPTGLSPYQIQWSNNANTATIGSLQGGTYTVTVSDATGCSANASVTVVEPPHLSVTLNISDAHCGLQNGGVAVTANGGTSGYTYHWSTNASTSAISNLSAGSYDITVTDAHSCTAITSATVSTSANLSLADSLKNISCNGNHDGTITVSTTAGTAPYGYLWASGATGGGLVNLSAGTYSVTATDAVGCSTVATYTIAEPSVLSVALSPVNATCGLFNGRIVALTSGGTGAMGTNGTIISPPTPSTICRVALIRLQ